MSREKMGFADKMIFVIGLILSGVIAFALVMGVIVALIKYYFDSKKRTVKIHSIPVKKDAPPPARIPGLFKQRDSRDESDIEDYLRFIDWEFKQPGSLDAEVYSNLVHKLSEAYRRNDRHEEADYCISRMNNASEGR